MLSLSLGCWKIPESTSEEANKSCEFWAHFVWGNQEITQVLWRSGYMFCLSVCSLVRLSLQLPNFRINNNCNYSESGSLGLFFPVNSQGKCREHNVCLFVCFFRFLFCIKEWEIADIAVECAVKYSLVKKAYNHSTKMKESAHIGNDPFGMPNFWQLQYNSYSGRPAKRLQRRNNAFSRTGMVKNGLTDNLTNASLMFVYLFNIQCFIDVCLFIVCFTNQSCGI